MYIFCTLSVFNVIRNQLKKKKHLLTCSCSIGSNLLNDLLYQIRLKGIGKRRWKYCVFLLKCVFIDRSHMDSLFHLICFQYNWRTTKHSQRWTVHLPKRIQIENTFCEVPTSPQIIPLCFKEPDYNDRQHFQLHVRETKRNHDQSEIWGSDARTHVGDWSRDNEKGKIKNSHVMVLGSRHQLYLTSTAGRKSVQMTAS